MKKFEKFLKTLNRNYSTTRLCYKLLGDNCLDKNGKIKRDFKAKITIPEAGIRNSRIEKQGNEKVNTYLFLPENKNRIGEGGLRTKGYLKFNYEIENGKWHACDFRGKRLFEVDPPKYLDLDIKKLKSDDGIIRLPLITIITVVLNRKNELEETIESVINQTYPNIEYIIIDGGSTDGTLEVIKKYENYIDYWMSEPDEGIYDAMNKGISLAFGQWINFMNAGDKFYDETAVKKIFLDKKYMADVIYGDTEIIRDRKLKKLIRAGNLKNLVNGMIFSHQSAFIKGSVHKENLYDTSFNIAADFELIFRLWRLRKTFKYTNSIISIMKIDDTSFSIKNNNITMLEWWKITGKKQFILKSYLVQVKKIIKKLIPSKLLELYLTYIKGYQRIE